MIKKNKLIVGKFNLLMIFVLALSSCAAKEVAKFSVKRAVVEGVQRAESEIGRGVTNAVAMACLESPAPLTKKKSCSGLSFAGMDLSGMDLSGIAFRDSDFSNADLTGTNLNNADLRNANLKGADLTGARMTGAKIRGAIMPDGTIGE
jgi:uncharacterized protein YjbI with pentapeptide repeats